MFVAVNFILQHYQFCYCKDIPGASGCLLPLLCKAVEWLLEKLPVKCLHTKVLSLLVYTVSYVHECFGVNQFHLSLHVASYGSMYTVIHITNANS